MLRWNKISIAYAQTVEVVLDGVALDITVRANEPFCEMDIGLAGEAPAITGIRMVGNIDLIAMGRARANLGVPGVFMTVDENQNAATPTPDTLGSTVFLYYITDSAET